MTAQWADKLKCEHPGISFDDLYCYGVTRKNPFECAGWDGVIGDLFDYPRKPIERTGGLCTACYRGYIASLVLNEDGTLTLAKFEYFTPTDSNPLNFEQDIVNKILTGDFWLILRRNFETGPTCFIPFRNGRIIPDRSQWVTKPDDATG